MPITIKRLPDQPILVADFVGKIDTEDVRQYFADSDALIADGETMIYRINDCRHVEVDFMSAMKIIQAVREDTAGSAKDPRIHGLFIGTNVWTKMARDVLRQKYIGIEVAIFNDMSDALKYVEIQEADRAS